jgi:hypothetical protein
MKPNIFPLVRGVASSEAWRLLLSSVLFKTVDGASKENP